MPLTRKDEPPILLDPPEVRGPSVDHLRTTAHTRAVADAFLAFLETGDAPAGLFDPDAFLDFTSPTWRQQALGLDDVVALRRLGHPWPGRVAASRFDPTPTGFVLEVAESWMDDDGAPWRCRELFRADVGADGITELAVYCTGDWDAARVAQHAASVTLIRP